MPAGISIGVGADTRDFASGVKKGIIEPLEDTKTALDDIAKASDKTGTDLEQTFRDQQRATAENARDYKQMSEDIRNTSRRTNQQIGDDAHKSSREVSAGVEEAHESLRSNAIETAASFDGSFEGISGGLQGLLSEFAAGFGPAGIVAGLVLASGLGLLTNAIEGGTEAAEDQKQAVSDLASEYIEAGKSGRRAFDDVANAITAMATSTDGKDVAITLQTAYDRAKEAGADYQEVVESIAQASPAQLQRVIDQVRTLERQHLDSGDAATREGRLFDAATDRSSTGAAVLLKALEKTKGAAEQAARAQKLAAEAGLSDFQLKADAIAQVEQAYDDAAAGANHFNKKTGEFDATGYLKEMRKVRKELLEFRDDLAQSDLSPAAKKFLESQGAESAAAMLRGYKAASPDQKRELGEIWRTAGTENASSYEDALGKKVSDIKVQPPKIPKPVVPAPDTSALDRYLALPGTKRIVLDVVTRSGQKVP